MPWLSRKRTKSSVITPPPMVTSRLFSSIEIEFSDLMSMRIPSLRWRMVVVTQWWPARGENGISLSRAYLTVSTTSAGQAGRTATMYVWAVRGGTRESVQIQACLLTGRSYWVKRRFECSNSSDDGTDTTAAGDRSLLRSACISSHWFSMISGLVIALLMAVFFLSFVAFNVTPRISGQLLTKSVPLCHLDQLT